MTETYTGRTDVQLCSVEEFLDDDLARLNLFVSTDTRASVPQRLLPATVRGCEIALKTLGATYKQIACKPGMISELEQTLTYYKCTDRRIVHEQVTNEDGTVYADAFYKFKNEQDFDSWLKHSNS